MKISSYIPQFSWLLSLVYVSGTVPVDWIPEHKRIWSAYTPSQTLGRVRV